MSRAAARQRSWGPSAALLVAVLALSGSSRAQSDDRMADAKALFDAGTSAVAQNELTRARALFLQSQALYPAAGTLLNLADCEEKLGLVASARRHYEQALALLHATSKGNERGRIQFAEGRVAALTPRVPKLRIDPSPDTAPGTAVLLDGNELSASNLGKDLPLDPGKHSVKVTAPGRAARTWEIELKEGEMRLLTAEPGLPDQPLAPRSDGSRPMRTVGLVLGGAGLTGFGVWAVTGILALEKNSQLRQMCPVPTTCTVAGEALARERDQLAMASTVGLITGLSLTAVAVTLLVVDRQTRPRPAVSILPAAGGIVVNGKF